MGETLLNSPSDSGIEKGEEKSISRNRVGVAIPIRERR